ncbi:MAG: hypothetical protein F6K24_02150 [Okeania sp. SIO2D1]|nr:hypothetical protein [Okeania sp. SIO2D1]
MEPTTTVTIGMITTLGAVMLGSWQVFRYVGRLEHQIKENAANLTNLEKTLREKDRRLLREMKRHRLCVKDVENFLSKKMEYHIRPFIEMEETDI